MKDLTYVFSNVFEKRCRPAPDLDHLQLAIEVSKPSSEHLVVNKPKLEPQQFHDCTAGTVQKQPPKARSLESDKRNHELSEMKRGEN